MRVINYTLGLFFCGFIACGGESDVDKPNDGKGEAGDSGVPPSGGGEAGSSESAGSAGDGNNPGAGGTSGRGGGSSSGGPGSGAVAGGVPLPPAGGRPMVPPPPTAGGPGQTPVPPEGCEVQSASVGAGYCSAFLTCTNAFMQVDCKEDGTGNGICYCNSSSGYQELGISGTPQLSTCTEIADVCLGAGDPGVEEECTPSFTMNGSTTCMLQEKCVRSLEGSDAQISRNRSVSCIGSDPVSCSCEFSGAQLRVDASSPDGVCARVIEHCDDPPPATGGGPLTCEPRMQSSADGYCSVYEECLSETDLGDGITAVSIHGRNANCTTISAGVSSCYCNAASSSLQFEIDVATNGIGACLTATELCASGEEVDLEGEATCTRTNQTASSTDCYASMNCVKSGSIADQAIRVYGSLSASCYGQGNAYNCTCSSGIESAGLEVDAGTAWDACSLAVEECPSIVEPSFNGGIGAGGVGPVPVPPPGRPMPF